MDSVSVIIPTRNRTEKLLRALRALEAQTLDRHAVEVLVVDDGSTEPTAAAVAGFSQESPLRVRLLAQPPRGAGAARNAGIRAARSELLVFLGDDTIAPPDFLQQHLRCHGEAGLESAIAVVGYTTWPEDMRVTPFMRFVGECGPQFDYARMKPNGRVPFCCFYTSNLSLPRRVLERLAYAFDEDFSVWGWEDTELGYRLERLGVPLYYHPAAVVYHDHPTGIAAFCRRQRAAGKSSRILLEKHPELEPHLGRSDRMARRARMAFLATWTAPVGDFLDRVLRLRLPALYYRAVITLAYAQGVASAANHNPPPLSRERERAGTAGRPR